MLGAYEIIALEIELDNLAAQIVQNFQISITALFRGFAQCSLRRRLTWIDVSFGEAHFMDQIAVALDISDDNQHFMVAVNDDAPGRLVKLGLHDATVLPQAIRAWERPASPVY